MHSFLCRDDSITSHAADARRRASARPPQGLQRDRIAGIARHEAWLRLLVSHLHASMGPAVVMAGHLHQRAWHTAPSVMARGGGAKSPCVVVAGARLQKVIATKFSIRDLPALPAPGFIRRWQRREHLEVSGRMKRAAMVTEKQCARQRWPHRALHLSRGHTDGLRARLIKTFTAHIDHLDKELQHMPRPGMTAPQNASNRPIPGARPAAVQTPNW